MEEAALRTRRLLGALALATVFAVPSVSAAYFGSLLSTDGGIDGTGSRITLGPSDSFTANEIFYLQGDVGSVEIGSIDFRVPPPPVPYGGAPEPTTLILLGSGLLGSVAVFRRRRK